MKFQKVQNEGIEENCLVGNFGNCEFWYVKRGKNGFAGLFFIGDEQEDVKFFESKSRRQNERDVQKWLIGLAKNNIS